MNYEEDIKIDDTALDVEWLEQPGLMLRYSRHAANARMEVDKAKEAFELTKAELDKEIRSYPDRFGIEKITDKVVENTLPMQKDYKEASERLINAKFELDVANGALRAMEARKDALENLARLLGLQYFAGPKIPRNLSEEKESRQAKINSSIANKIRSRQRTT